MISLNKTAHTNKWIMYSFYYFADLRKAIELNLVYAITIRMILIEKIPSTR